MKNFILAILMMLSAGAYASGVSSTSNYNPAAVTITGGTGAFTGEVSATGGTGGKITLQASTGDVIATRAGGATGGIFFNTAKTSYLYFDSTQLFLIGGAVNVPSLTTAGSVSSSSPTAGIGYVAGSGGVVTQGTSISTTVTINKTAGRITTISNSFVAGTAYSFVLSNSTVNAGDFIGINADVSPLYVNVKAEESASGGFIIVMYCNTAITTVINMTFVVIKGSRN